jgi:hypothetical protein
MLTTSEVFRPQHSMRELQSEMFVEDQYLVSIIANETD